MKKKILSAIICASLLLAACGATISESETKETYVAPDESIETELINTNEVSIDKDCEREMASKTAQREDEFVFSTDQEGWVYEKIENSALPDSIGKDEMLLMACKDDLHVQGAHEDCRGVWIDMEGYYRISLVFVDGTMYCANVNVDSMHYELSEVPDHKQDWQDIYYVGKLPAEEVHEISEVMDQVKIDPNRLNDESSWIDLGCFNDKHSRIEPAWALNITTMYAYLGESAKEGQEIVGHHFREYESGTVSSKAEMIDEPHTEKIIEWFTGSPLYSYFQRHMQETG